MKRDTGEIFFELYNLEMFPEDPPPAGSIELLRVPIDKMLATAESKTGIKWTRVSTREIPVKRIRRQTWEYVVVDNSSSSSSSSSSDSSSSDEEDDDDEEEEEEIESRLDDRLVELSDFSDDDSNRCVYMHYLMMCLYLISSLIILSRKEPLFEKFNNKKSTISKKRDASRISSSSSCSSSSSNCVASSNNCSKRAKQMVAHCRRRNNC
jgi:hypothetical protein